MPINGAGSPRGPGTDSSAWRSALLTFSVSSSYELSLIHIYVYKRQVLRLLRMKVEAEEEAVTEEEIRLMVDLGEEKGTIDASEKELIENIFEFDNTKVDEVMTRCVDIIAIQKDARPKDILALIRSSGLSRFPVYGRDINDILGILNTREYLLNQVKGSLCL